MARVGQGDASAFEVVYERHASAAFSLAYRMVGSRVAAEEVAQEAFMALWRNGDRYQAERASARTWLLGIVHKRAIDALRRSTVRDRRRASDEGIEERFEAAERTDDQVAQREEAASVRGLLDELPAEQGRVVELAFYGGYTHTEIASMLDMPLGTVKGRMRLAMAKMKTGLEATA